MPLPARLLAPACAFLLCVAPAPAPAEELHLVNGDRLTGRIVAFSDEKVEVDTAYGRVSVPRARLAKILFARAGEGALPGGATVDELLALVEAAKIRFLADGKRIPGAKLAEGARLRAHLLPAGRTDARRFVDICLARSDAGKPVLALLPDGRRVPLSDWLDATLAGGTVPPEPPAEFPARAARHARGADRAR